jgi:hypothetical protein
MQYPPPEQASRNSNYILISRPLKELRFPVGARRAEVSWHRPLLDEQQKTFARCELFRF